MLPIAPFTETSGTFINAEGRVQSFKGAAAPYADTRPGWKVLRVLGKLFQLSGFDEESCEAVRDSFIADGIESRLGNEIKGEVGVGLRLDGLERVADVPIYRSDSIVRRSAPLQQAGAAQAPAARMNEATLAK